MTVISSSDKVTKKTQPLLEIAELLYKLIEQYPNSLIGVEFHLAIAHVCAATILIDELTKC